MLGSSLLNILKEKISSLIFQNSHKIEENSFTRSRKLPFATIFSMILKAIKKSLSIECELLEPDELIIPPSKQAFSKARYKIKHTGFQELLEDSLIETYLKDPK